MCPPKRAPHLDCSWHKPLNHMYADCNGDHSLDCTPWTLACSCAALQQLLFSASRLYLRGCTVAALCSDLLGSWGPDIRVGS